MESLVAAPQAGRTWDCAARAVAPTCIVMSRASMMKLTNQGVVFCSKTGSKVLKFLLLQAAVLASAAATQLCPCASPALDSSQCRSLVGCRPPCGINT